MYLPKGTYCEFDVDDYIGESDVMEVMPGQQQPQENTQEELAS